MNQTILLVDDEPQIRAALRRALRQAAYTILEAGGGEEALSILSAQPVDLLISDLNMPGMGGLVLCRRVAAEHPGVVRFLMTGQTDQRLARKAIEEGTLFHAVQKPCDIDELCLLLRLGLSYRELYQEKERLLALVRAQRQIIAQMEESEKSEAAADSPLLK
jgi:DNA-binding NtrC family response regulator